MLRYQLRSTGALNPAENQSILVIHDSLLASVCLRLGESRTELIGWLKGALDDVAAKNSFSVELIPKISTDSQKVFI